MKVDHQEQDIYILKSIEQEKKEKRLMQKNKNISEC